MMKLKQKELIELIVKANAALILEENIDLVYCLSHSPDASLAPVIKELLREAEIQDDATSAALMVCAIYNWQSRRR